MSVQALTWAFDVEGLTSTQKFILVVLGNYADEDNRCFPGQERIASVVGVTRQTVSQNLKALEGFGFISRERRERENGSRTSDRFVLHVGGNVGKLNVGQTVGQCRDFHESMSAKQGDQNLKITISEPSDGDLLDLSFERFYRTYPKKVGKQDAMRAFRKAVKVAGGVEVVLAGVDRYAADPNLPPKQFIPNPSTWLNRGSWDDEPLPERDDAPAAAGTGDWMNQ